VDNAAKFFERDIDSFRKRYGHTSKPLLPLIHDIKMNVLDRMTKFGMNYKEIFCHQKQCFFSNSFWICFSFIQTSICLKKRISLCTFTPTKSSVKLSLRSWIGKAFINLRRLLLPIKSNHLLRLFV